MQPSANFPSPLHHIFLKHHGAIEKLESGDSSMITSAAEDALYLAMETGIHTHSLNNKDILNHLHDSIYAPIGSTRGATAHLVPTERQPHSHPGGARAGLALRVPEQDPVEHSASSYHDAVAEQPSPSRIAGESSEGNKTCSLIAGSHALLTTDDKLVVSSPDYVNVAG